MNSEKNIRFGLIQNKRYRGIYHYCIGWTLFSTVTVYDCNSYTFQISWVTHEYIIKNWAWFRGGVQCCLFVLLDFEDRILRVCWIGAPTECVTVSLCRLCAQNSYFLYCREADKHIVNFLCLSPKLPLMLILSVFSHVKLLSWFFFE